MRVVWTLHNVLPHTPIFADDRRARRRLVDACDLVIAHSPSALDDLERRTGARPRLARVIPLGPFAVRAPRVPRRASRHVAFFGKIELYKGVEELLEAFALLPADCPLRLTVAGACTDPSLRERIERGAARLGPRVTLRLEHLPATDVNELLADIDALVLPFRAVTTTSTASQAQAHGVPVVLPDLPNLGDLRAGAIRYDGSVAELTATLEALSRLDARELDALGAAAYASAHSRTWARRRRRDARRIRTRHRKALMIRARTVLARLRGDAMYRSSSLLVVNLMLLAGFGFLFWTVAARLYAAPDVGLMSGWLATCSLLATLGGLGLANMLIRHLAGHLSHAG